MFSGTKALSSLKGVFPPIHQPLPLNRREAQQLLSALTTSFRRNLDREHGWLHDEPSPSSPFDPAAAAPTSPKDFRRPADRHLRAILSNPLFSYDRTAHQASGRPATERDPMDVFDEAVARGLMTTRRAAGCLQAKQRQIVQSPSLSIKQAMSESGAGLRVVQWLRSSGLERDLSFVAYPALASPLLNFMVAEDLEEIAWSWIHRLMQGEGPEATVKQQPVASFLLDSLISAKADGASNLDDAYSILLRGEEIFKSTPAYEQNIILSWRHLSWLSTVDAWRRSAPSEVLFESFVAIGNCLRKPLQIDRAHLSLHHPTQPSHTLAVKFLQNESLWQNALQKPRPSDNAQGERTKHKPSRLSLRLASMGLDTVRHLTETGQSEEAQWVLNLLGANFAGYFGNSSPEFAKAFSLR